VAQVVGMISPKRDTGPNALRRGRVSIPQADYFVTVCLHPRRDLLVPSVADVLLREAKCLTSDGSWTLRCLTVMPDHAHVLFTLGQRLNLSQVVARLKAKTQTLVRSQGSDWQDNFYDHKVRPEDSIEQIIRYFFKNPVRAGLIT
jgi:REP element-mobilizing transposase RayT